MEYKVYSKKEKKEYSDVETKAYKEFCKMFFADCPHAGSVSTPYSLCEEIVDKLPDLNGKSVLVLFNPEFYLAVLKNYPDARITMITGSETAQKAKFKNVEKAFYFSPHNPNALGALKIMGKKFDVVVGNPPFNAPKKFKKGPNQSIYPDFIKKSLELVNNNGYVALIHPSAWRKPENELWELLTEKNIKYIQMLSEQDGRNIFGAGVRVDWYVLCNEVAGDKSVIIDHHGDKLILDLRDMRFLSSGSIKKLNDILAKKDEKKLKILYNSSYHAQREFMSENKCDKYQYPCIHSMVKNGIKLRYSSKNNNGHFNISKVIINIGRYLYPYNDFDGKYGMTQTAFGIIINSKEEGDNIIKAINSNSFAELIKDTKWGTNAMVEWRMFKYFKKDFWKEFV